MTQAPAIATQRAAEVRRALSRVDDPELDEPVTDLRFVERIDIRGTEVAIGFRLPTYWCAANFAFLMADGMRREVAALPWVTKVEVTLGEHMYADKINRGLAQGKSFQESFGADANGNLDDLRGTFLVKAFQRRQEALLRHLLAEGRPAAFLCELSLDELDALDLSAEGATLRERYLARRDVCASRTQTLAFVDAHGAALQPHRLDAYLQDLARVGVNASFNGVLCRSLLAARFSEPSEPTITLHTLEAQQ